MKCIPLVLALALTTYCLVGCGGDGPKSIATEKKSTNPKQYSQPPPMTIDIDRNYRANMNTSKGAIIINLLPLHAPLAVNNFVFLAREGYYDNLTFHRVIKDFMIQGGDPTGTGTGGPGYTFDDDSITRGYSRGTLAMANTGPNTNGSQFFIMHKAKFDMPKDYTIFGVVILGMKVVDAIAETPVIANSTGEISKPVDDMIIESIEISEVSGYQGKQEGSKYGG